MLLVLLSLMISVGFFTLMERKILGLSQMRLGPNKTMIMGLIQPILDGLKLFKKIYLVSMKSFFLIYHIMSIIMLLIAFMLWSSMPLYLWGSKLLLILLFLFLLGLSSFCLLLLGWSSYNKYSFLGSIRSLGQTMSFEVNFSLILFLIFLMSNKINFSKKNLNSFLLFSFFFLLIWTLILMETQRSPMDLSEGESELVSGYNIEFSSIMFTFIFLSEYMNIILLSGIMWVLISKLYAIWWSISLFFMLLMRTCYPRMRLDLLIVMSWLKLLPISISLFLLLYVFKFI